MATVKGMRIRETLRAIFQAGAVRKPRAEVETKVERVREEKLHTEESRNKVGKRLHWWPK